MPVLKFRHVHSFSSEDQNNPADNLLSEDTFRKWLCANAGEKQASVVLQLDKASLINAIDIGNYGSAFVEVLVSRSGDDGDNYEVLLVTSSFMSPAESKSWNNTTRVRMFGKDKLSKSVATQKWDRVKLVCTQPYNKTEKYGLSFVKLHSPAEPSNEGAGDITLANPVTFGGFSLRDEAKTLSPGSFFQRRDKSDSGGTLVATAAAQARMASREAEKEAVVHVTSPAKSKNSQSIKDTKKHLTTSNEARASSRTKEELSSKRSAPKQDSEVPKKKTKETVEEDKVLSGVTFALSGFKNPYRGELRDKATALGARYAPDWGPSCTHLICAFTSTPKFNQVKDAGGLIVRKEWIIDCHRKKVKLPTDKYQMTNKASAEGDDRESSDDDKASPPLYRKGDTLSCDSKKGKGKAPVKKSPPKVSTDPSTSGVIDLDPYGGSTDDEGASPKISPRVSSIESDGGDTEDEIRRIKVKQNKEEDEDPYGGSTDEETGDKEATDGTATRSEGQRSLLDLPNLFSKCCFFLYGDFTDTYRTMIIRYITAYDGDIAEYMGDKVTHIVTDSKWDDNFDEALADNSALTFVKPKWIFACHDKQKLVPSQPYIVVPT